RWTDLTTELSSEPEHVVSDIDLGGIQITPVEFYLNQYGSLCSVHQAVIPGRLMEVLLSTIVDEMLENSNKHIEERESKQVQHLEFRRPTWDEVRTVVLLHLPDIDADQKPQKIPESFRSELTPLDANSRDRLKKANENKSMRLVRSGDRFSWTV